MKQVAIFQSEAYERLDEPTDVNEESRPPEGNKCAQRLIKILSIEGISFEFDEPVEEETAWFLYARMGDARYQIVVSLAVAMDQNEYFWCLLVDVRQGWVRRLFSRKPVSVDLGNLCAVIDRALAEEERNGRIQRLSWLSREEFYATYAR